MNFKFFALLGLALLILSSCSIYRSPDRRDFESESPTFRTQNLVPLGCSSQTLRRKALASRLVTISQNPRAQESEFLWEYRILNKSYFESDNLKGAYCVYANN